MGPDQRKPHDTNEVEPAPSGLKYSSAKAFNVALNDKLANAAKHSPYAVIELRRQFAYDRFLTRLFCSQPNDWVLKGGASLLARLPGQARHSMDIDLYFQAEHATAQAGIMAAADLDIGDYFSFDVSSAGALTGFNPGSRFKIVAFIGEIHFSAFGVDAAIATNMTAAATATPPITNIDIPGLITTTYRSYPIVDHVADKHAAMISTYQGGQPSTRYRDLVDLVLITYTQRLSAPDLRSALLSEYAQRGLTPPTKVTLPSPAWISGWTQAAAAIEQLRQLDAHQAITAVSNLLDPILNDTAAGTWDPTRQHWLE